MPTDDAEMRLRFFRAAADGFRMPDPVGSLTIAAVANRSGIPGSTILDQIEIEADPDGPMVEFRRLVFHELIRRVKPAPVDDLQRIAVEALQKEASLPAIVAELVDAVADQFRDDPSSRFLLAAASRIPVDRDLSQITTEVWASLTEPVLRLIELVVAARGFGLVDGVGQAQLLELLAVAVADASVWDMVLGQEPVPLDGVADVPLSPPALLVWSTLEPLLVPLHQDH